MDNNKKAPDINDYLIVLTENQLAIKHLTQTVDRLGKHVEKLVDENIDMKIKHGDINVVKNDMEFCDIRITKLENNQTWLTRGFIGGVFSFIVTIVVVIIKGP